MSVQAGAEPRPDGVTASSGGAPVGPLRAVLDALGQGRHTRADLARATGLSPDVVDAALEHLVRIGRVRAEHLGGGCPSSGCGGCASGRADASAGCGAPGPASSRGPIALTLVERRAR